MRLSAASSPSITNSGQRLEDRDATGYLMYNLYGKDAQFALVKFVYFSRLMGVCACVYVNVYR